MNSRDDLLNRILNSNVNLWKLRNLIEIAKDWTVADQNFL